MDFLKKKKCLLLEAYPEKCQTSKMELFANFQPLTNYVKNSILYVRQGSEYNSDQPIKEQKLKWFKKQEQHREGN